MLKRFGRLPSGNRKERMEKAPNFRDGEFWNVEDTDINPKNLNMFKMLAKFANRPSNVQPSEELPNIKTDLHTISSEKSSMVWFGHSSYFLKMNETNILVDPVFSGNASPFTFFGKAFEGADHYDVDDMPAIDLLILTHDHYDHLDYKTLVKLKPKVDKIVTSLGVASHLEHWGYDAKIITELNWWETTEISSNFKLTAAPSRHFSGRGLTRFKTLWSSFILEKDNHRIYLGGDSGYSKSFKEIGEKFGKFDLAILECGQYSEDWPQIHMMPEETVKAARDLNAEFLFPVHWAKFVLSTHPWNESIKRLVRESEKIGQAYVSPLIGQVYTLGENFEQVSWWEEVD